MPQLFPLDERGETFFRRYRNVRILAGGIIMTDFLDLYRGCWTIVGFIFPAAFTNGEITFQSSPPADDDTPTTWHDVYDDAGAEVEVAVTVGAWVHVSPSLFAGIRYLKVRSGVSGGEVPEAATRTIRVIVRPV